MGCDIHIVLEFKETGDSKWIGQLSSENYKMVRSKMHVAQRDYAFFAEVAGVRGSPSGEGHYPQNLPRDVSDLAWSEYMRAPTDYHNPSHLTPKEFCDAWVRCNDKRAVGREEVRSEFLIYDLLGIDPDDERREYRVVFWFDN